MDEKLNSFYYLTTIISSYSVIIPIILLAVRYRYLRKDSVLLCVYLLVSFLTEWLHVVLVKWHANTAFVSEYFSLAEFVLVFSIYWVATPAGYRNWIIRYFAPVIGVLAFSYSMLAGDMRIYNAVYQSILVAYGIYYLNNVYLNPDTRNSNLHFFWYNCGFLIFLSVSLVLIIIRPHVTPGPYLSFLWFIFHLVNFSLYLLLSIGVWKTKSI